MTETVRYRCLNCGHKFQEEILTEAEQREARREGQNVSQIHCPECHRRDIARGWD